MRATDDIIKRLEFVENVSVSSADTQLYKLGYVNALKWVLTVHQVRPITEDEDPILGGK